jgi:two-component system, chemotaxis family, sensor kinase CheA
MSVGDRGGTGPSHDGPPDELLDAFAAESAEVLATIGSSVSALEAGSPGALDELFRAVHTLKGSAGIVGFDRLESFAHAFETRLADLRSGRAKLGPDAPGALLACRDNLASLLAAPSGGSSTEAESRALRVLDLALGRAFEPAPESARGASTAATPTGEEPAAGASGGGFSRVANRKLDTLLEESLELTQALSELGGRLRSGDTSEAVEELLVVHALAAQHHRSILEARTEPFGAVAETYRRAVEEIAASSGKEIEFEILGAETEIDRALADKLTEPLLHLSRNAADHGIEPPAAREAAGKPRTGRITLSARREASALIVRVEDDGRGVDPEALREKAESEGIAIPEGWGSEKDRLLSLLTLPGFSLSKKVTKWSGRGVGLDAVERGLRRSRGSLSFVSVPGKLFAAEMRLPLALSLVEGFTAVAGGTSLLVPFEAVSSCEATDAGLGGRLLGTLATGGRSLPAIDLSVLYGAPEGARRVAIIVQGAGEDSPTALLVDEVGESLSVAVRPVDRRLADSPGLAGIAVLGDGSLVLVLDVRELVRKVDGGKLGA